MVQDASLATQVQELDSESSSQNDPSTNYESNSQNDSLTNDDELVEMLRGMEWKSNVCRLIRM